MDFTLRKLAPGEMVRCAVAAGAVWSVQSGFFDHRKKKIDGIIKEMDEIIKNYDFLMEVTACLKNTLVRP